MEWSVGKNTQCSLSHQCSPLSTKARSKKSKAASRSWEFNGSNTSILQWYLNSSISGRPSSAFTGVPSLVASRPTVLHPINIPNSLISQWIAIQVSNAKEMLCLSLASSHATLTIARAPFSSKAEGFPCKSYNAFNTDSRLEVLCVTALQDDNILLYYILQ